METYLIAGLGNPDKKYDETRHNAGFKAIDKLASRLGVSISEKKFKSLSGSLISGGKKLILIKPQTYMNLSGEAVSMAANYFNIEPDHIIIISDDINFPCGRLRIRAKGSAGGHNGLKSIIALLGSSDFPRVRIGVGDKKENMDLAAHVLGRFEKDDADIMDKAYEKAAEAVLCIIENGTTEAMNRYNGMDLRPKEKEQDV